MSDSVRNLITGHAWIFQTYNNPNTNLKNNRKMCHWAQNQASALAIPVLWPERCRRWVRWTEEKKLWIWRIWSDSGWRNGLWSLVRCSLTSSGIIGDNVELLNWQTEVGAVNCGQCVLDNYFPHFKLLLSNEMLDFCDKKKDQKD